MTQLPLTNGTAQGRSTAISIALHVTAVGLLLWTSSTVRNMPARISAAVTPLFDPLPIAPAFSQHQIGGGGGMREQTPASAGRLPKIADRQFVPPTLQLLNPHPKLAMEMTIEAPPETALLNRDLTNLGDPLSKYSALSGGMGGPLGIGNGGSTGVGDRRGPGAGNGDSLKGTVYRGGQGVTLPSVIYKVEPEFSEEARKAHYSGTVLIAADVDSTGHPRNIRVMKSLGMGLDERAVEAVSKWLFRAGTKDGKPVAVSAVIEVSFRLL